MNFFLLLLCRLFSPGSSTLRHSSNFVSCTFILFSLCEFFATLLCNILGQPSPDHTLNRPCSAMLRQTQMLHKGRSNDQLFHVFIPANQTHAHAQTHTHAHTSVAALQRRYSFASTTNQITHAHTRTTHARACVCVFHWGDQYSLWKMILFRTKIDHDSMAMDIRFRFAPNSIDVPVGISLLQRHQAQTSGTVSHESRVPSSAANRI